jgi:hypothetical protein
MSYQVIVKKDGRVISRKDVGNWRDHAAEQYATARNTISTNHEITLVNQETGEVLLHTAADTLIPNCDSCLDDTSIDCHDCEQHQGD